MDQIRGCHGELHRELVGASGAPSTKKQRALPILWKHPFDWWAVKDSNLGPAD